jgi:pSer/pThr/pTyr-binding forkhead associated (FHA) protein
VNLRLTVGIPLVSGETRDYEYVFEQDVVTLGRDEESDVQIPIPQISAHHAQILLEDEHCCLVDLGSAMGTIVSGSRAEAGLRTPLMDGTEINLAGCVIRVSFDTADVPEESHEQTQQVAFRMVREVMGSMGGATSKASPYVEVINDEERGQKVKLQEEGVEFLLGRDSDCQVILSHWSVSRHHARIVRTGTGATIEDLGSKNGVMLNEDVVKEPQAISDGDIVFVGHTQIRFHDPSQSFLGQPTDDPPSIQIDMKTSSISVEEVRAASARAKESAGSSPAEEAKPESPARSPYSATPRNEPGSSKTWIIVSVILVLLVGAAAAAYFLLEL